MASVAELGGDISAAAAALAGLLLVYIGAISTSFDSYQKQEQASVRGRYQRRAWFAFIGFVLAILSVAFALLGKWLHQDCFGFAALICLGGALIWCVFTALFSVREIK